MRGIIISLMAACWFTSAMADPTPFDDTNLQHLKGTGQAGIVYLWTPYMPLSILGLSEAEEVANRLDMDFTAVLDPASGREWSFLETQEDLKPYSRHYMSSFELLDLGVLNHFPAVVIYRDGEIIPTVIHGYEEPQGLETYIIQILKGEL